MTAQGLQNVTVWILPILFAITLHEAAHGYVAKWCGDRTAQMMGRLSFNPIRHIDPVGTILVPAIGVLTGAFIFGWAKPVPVNFGALRHKRRDAALVAGAGPAMNVLIALVSIILLFGAGFLPGVAREWAADTLANSVYLNLVLAVFNMLPLPPLDGGRVAVALLPNPLSRQLAELEPIGLLIIMGVLFLLPMLGDAVHADFNLFRPLVQEPALWLEGVLVALVRAVL
jgi:Zn-dependent protease